MNDPGKRSRALVCVLLGAALALSGLVACQVKETAPLEDGVYCATGNITYPVGKDYGSLRLSLQDFDLLKGKPGEGLGEYTLPLSKDLILWKYAQGQERPAGEKGSEEWRLQVDHCVHMPDHRNVVLPDGLEDCLVLEVQNGEVTALSWRVLEETATEPTPEGTVFQSGSYDGKRTAGICG